MAVFIAVPFLVIILLDIVAYRESPSLFCSYPDPVGSRFASIAISQTLERNLTLRIALMLVVDDTGSFTCSDRKDAPPKTPQYAGPPIPSFYLERS
jgi:hypothetical protein